MSYDDELALEQAHVDRAYARLEALRGFASELAVEAAGGAGEGGTFAERFERDVRIGAGLARLEVLRPDARPLCFARLDQVDGERFHLGRVGVIDDDGEPLVVDWRAPVAEPFYRATVSEPFGVARRRHLRGKGRTVTGLDDEVLVGFEEGSSPAETTDDLVGQAALLAVLAAERTGRMGDIVSTIQAEQDAAIRAPLPGVLVVQGGPGTGKTAVALHRAAYLLYTYRLRLGRQGVLIVGPNPVFLRYIDQVLPSLGETGIRLAMPHQVVTAHAVTEVEDPATARVKGDARMVDVLHRTVRARIRTPKTDVAVPWGGRFVTLTASDAKRIVRAIRRRPGTHNERRPLVERTVLRFLRAHATERMAVAVEAGVVGPEAGQVHARTFADAMAAEPVYRELLERLWPVLTPDEVLHDLWSRPALLRHASEGVLEETDRNRLARSGESSKGWTAADAVLLDELSAMLGRVPKPSEGAMVSRADTDDDAEPGADLTPEERLFVDRGLAAAELLPDCRNCGSELTYAGGDVFVCEQPECARTWRAAKVMPESHFIRFLELRDLLIGQLDRPEVALADDRFGHVVVDEAQELSPMQWRALSRRCPSGSMTVVGDLGQAGWEAPGTWTELLAVLPERWPVRVAELTVGYRTPTEVAEVAAAVLAETRPDLVPPRSVRASGRPPTAVHAEREQLVEVARNVAEAELARHGVGRVGVIVPAHTELHEGRGAEGSDDDDPEALERPIAWLHPSAAKGLEFDSVVLVEPADVVAGSPAGWRDLYVALTRTTEALTVVHSKPLPGPLARLPHR